MRVAPGRDGSSQFELHPSCSSIVRFKSGQVVTRVKRATIRGCCGGRHRHQFGPQHVQLGLVADRKQSYVATAAGLAEERSSVERRAIVFAGAQQAERHKPAVTIPANRHQRTATKAADGRTGGIERQLAHGGTIASPVNRGPVPACAGKVRHRIAQQRMQSVMVGLPGRSSRWFEQRPTG